MDEGGHPTARVPLTSPGEQSRDLSISINCCPKARSQVNATQGRYRALTLSEVEEVDELPPLQVELQGPPVAGRLAAGVAPLAKELP